MSERKIKTHSRQRRGRLTGVVSKAVLFLLLGWSLWWVGRQIIASKWSGKSRLTLALAAPSLGVLTLDPATKTGVLLKIPDSVRLPLAWGYGGYPAVSLWSLDKQEAKGGQLVKDSLSDYLGVVIHDSVTGSGGSAGVGSLAAVRKLFIQAVKAKILRQKFPASGLSIWDMVRIFGPLTQTRKWLLELVDLEASAVLSEVRQPDGSIVLETDSQRLTALAQKWFGDEQLLQEGLGVVVINTTGEAGLGKKIARIAGTSGIQVLAIADNDWKMEKSEVRLKDKELKRSATVRLLEELLYTEAVVGDTVDGRAGIVVLIGEDIRRRWGQK